jgi:hypothetical protein
LHTPLDAPDHVATRSVHDIEKTPGVPVFAVWIRSPFAGGRSRS